MIIELTKSNRKTKKFKVVIKKNDKTKTIHFGAKSYGDYTIWNKEKGKEFADKKKKSYIARHKVNENWNKSGINTAGFWSRWLLWSKPTIEQSIKHIESKFNVNIVYRR